MTLNYAFPCQKSNNPNVYELYDKPASASRLPLISPSQFALSFTKSSYSGS